MLERRLLDPTLTGVSLAATGRTLHGLAAPFGVEAVVGGRRERITPGAFSATLSDGHDILALVDHTATHGILGRTSNGTLRLTETEAGLAYEIPDLAETTLANDILALARAGSLGGVSIGFRVPAGGERFDEGVRVLMRVDLVEVSIVRVAAAYEGTSVSVRSATPRLNRATRHLRTIR